MSKMSHFISSNVMSTISSRGIADLVIDASSSYRLGSTSVGGVITGYSRTFVITDVQLVPDRSGEEGQDLYR